jgi:putative ABC transport system ATP-binding protein
MLVAENLSKQFDSGGRPLTALRDVTFTVTAGAFVAVVGPSGSGKTTLLGLLAGLDTPSGGRVILDGVDLNTLNEDARARLRGQKVGFMFQNFQLIPSLTALENVQVPLELSGRTDGRETDPPDKRGREILARVGLAARGHHFPAQLSGGEQQRVALARAFANEPRILFADEPTGNLDGKTGAMIVDLIVSLNRESGTTVVLVTHEADIASRATRLIRLSDGAVVEDSETHGRSVNAGP